TVTIERDAAGNMTFKDHAVTLATLAELLVGSSVVTQLTDYVRRDGTFPWTGDHDAGGFDLGNVGTAAARVLHLISEPDEGTEGGVNLVTPMGLEGTATVTFHGGSGEVSLLG